MRASGEELREIKLGCDFIKTSKKKWHSHDMRVLSPQNNDMEEFQDVEYCKRVGCILHE